MNDMRPFMPEPGSGTAPVSSPIGSPRNFVLACIGLLSLMSDEIVALMERSAQRGNGAVERAQAEARRHAPPGAAPQVNLEWRIDLPHAGLPTHRDFEALLQQVTDLEQRIDRIAAQRLAPQ